VGLAVFQELPVGKQGLTEGARRLLQSLRHHPSLLAWIVRGEGRGAEETAVLVSELRKLDATRLVYVLGGPCGDFLAADAARVGERGKEAGRNGQALVVEAGGTAFAVPSHTWEGDARGGADPAEGYRRLYGQAAEWTERPGVAAVIYRQFADVAGECTGLVTADREVVKVNVAEGLMPRGLAEPKATTLIPAEKVEWGKDGALWRKEYGGERPLDEPWVAVRGTAQGSVSLNGGQVGRLEPTGGATLLRRLHHEARQRVSVVRNTLSVKANKPADDALLDIGLVGMAPVERRLPATLRILMDVWMRDTSICTGPDGTYYLTGTGGTPRGWFSDGIYVWKSRDLKAWEPLGQVWSLAKDSTWQLKGRQLAQTQLWAPEIHYAKGSFWLTYCTSYPPGPGVTNGCGLLRSTTGKPEGPYTDVKPDAPFARELDGSLFEDDDGTVYYLYGGCHIAKMKDDMSGLAEGFRQIGPAEGGPVGFEGISLFKANGKYYLSTAACPLPEENYDCMTAVGDSVYGPYRKHHVSVPRGGHNVFFKDRDGQWWSTYFGGDRNGPFWEKPALLRVEFAPDGTIHPLGPARP
jgi:hypothetical protein